MIRQVPAKDVEVLSRYEKKFGPLPTTLMMEPNLVSSLPDMCRDALSKGRALTLADLGVTPIPDGAVI